MRWNGVGVTLLSLGKFLQKRKATRKNHQHRWTSSLRCWYRIPVQNSVFELLVRNLKFHLKPAVGKQLCWQFEFVFATSIDVKEFVGLHFLLILVFVAKSQELYNILGNFHRWKLNTFITRQHLWFFEIPFLRKIESEQYGWLLEQSPHFRQCTLNYNFQHNFLITNYPNEWRRRRRKPGISKTSCK